jgi:CHAP domain
VRAAADRLQVRTRFFLLPLATVAAALLAPGAGAGGFRAGQCTTWAFLMRPDIVAQSALAGDGVGDWDADRWAANARKAGFPVGSQPRVGAIAVWPAHVLGAGPVGHVAYVEQVRSDGSFYVSEEDFDGSPSVHHRWVQPSSRLQFVYLRQGERLPSGPITPGGGLTSLTSAGTFAASGLAQTSVRFAVDASTDVSLRLTGPHVDRQLGWHVPGGAWTVGLDKIAGTGSLAPGTYKLIVFAYDTQLETRWLTFRLS